MTMALILAVPRRLAEGANVLTGDKRLGRLVADLDARPPHLGQAARHHRHGPDRPGGGAPRPAFGLQIHYHNRRRVAAADRGGARGDLLGEPRPDAGPHGHHLGQLPAHAGDLSTCCRRAGSSCCGRRPIIVNTARGEVIDENALIRMIEAGEIAGAGLDVFEHEPAVNPEARAARARGQGRAAAAHGLGHDRRPHRHGREGDHQHPHLHGRPQAAGPRAAVDAVKRQRYLPAVTISDLDYNPPSCRFSLGGAHAHLECGCRGTADRRGAQPGRTGATAGAR